MNRFEPKRRNSETIHNLNSWEYSMLISQCSKIKVCKNFLLKTLQLSVQRLRVLQKKLLNNESLEDMRGHTGNKVNQISESVLNEIKVFIDMIPKNDNHYNRFNRIEKQYFNNPSLTLKKLHELFIEYYEKKFKIKIKLSLT